MSSTPENEVPPQKLSHTRLLFSHTIITEEIVNHRYPGSGTQDDPYLVDWIPGDPRNPMTAIGPGMKWLITVIMALGTLSVTFSSTAFSGSIPQIQKDLHASAELSILSVSLFVLGFAIAPMTWAPMSELYGRQIIYAIMFCLVTVFGAGSIGSQNIQTLLVLRFFAGVFGSSSIVNSAGVITDMFVPKERGLAMVVYTSAPFLGPTIGPICGGFVAQYAGWRWVDGMTVIFTGVLWILGMIFVPETYQPYLLIRRAKKLSAMTGQKYVSKLEVGKPERKTIATFIYGTLYLIFTAFPIVYEQDRGWSQGVAGLPYIGVLVGQVFSMFFYVVMEVAYQKKLARNPSKAKPEGRLAPAMIGSVVLPIGLFWFAWSTYPHVHWIVGIFGAVLFGFGQVLLFISLINYVVDAYTIYAASALAGNAILRGLFGAAFPLFTTYMYQNLGSQWGSSVPAFLAAACLPLPFLFYRFGDYIRSHSKYAAEAQQIQAHMLNQTEAGGKSPVAQSEDEETALEAKERTSASEGSQKVSSISEKDGRVSREVS
ncbi:MAG: hypothetical protein Q9202_002015 [Teloschistes flavicans]